MTIFYRRISTPLGTLIATSSGAALTGLYYEGGRHAPPVQPHWDEQPEDAALAECARQLDDYFAGRREDFQLPLAPKGTAFQERVWREIARIPYGETISYAELARRAGAPGSARAAGAATGRNPHSIVVPCHRVLGSHGEITGYAGGLDRKKWLLRLEGTSLRSMAATAEAA